MTWTRDKVRNPNHGTTQATNLDMNLNMNIEQANNQWIKEKEKKKKTRHCTYPSGSIPGLEAGLPFLSTLSPPEVVDCRAD